MFMTQEERKERGVFWDIEYEYSEKTYCTDYVIFHIYDKTGRLRSLLKLDEGDVDMILNSLKHYKQVKKNVEKNREANAC